MDNLQNAEEYYILLINNFLSGCATNEENKILLEWLAQSEEHKKLFTKQAKLMDLSLISFSEGKFDSHKLSAWELLSQRIDNSENEANIQNTRKLYYLTKKISRIAALLLLTFSIGALISWWLTSRSYNQTSNKVVINEIEVPKGGRSTVTLPDGTRVWLNADTRLSYSNDYGTKTRVVNLQGEAYFHVKTNPKIPFVVQTSDLKIKATGTSFNVKAYPEEKYISTTLDEGIVKIEGAGIKLNMKPKQNITYYKKKSLISDSSKPKTSNKELETNRPKEERNTEPFVRMASNVNTQIYTSWKDNRWIIDSEDLSDIAILLERKFNVSVYIDSKELTNYKFTGTFKQETLEQILDVIRLSAPLKYQIKNGVVTIQLDKRRKANYMDLITN